MGKSINKGPKDFNKLMANIQNLLGEVQEKKVEVRREIKKKLPCKNHPDKIVYRNGLCKTCDEEIRNLRVKDRAAKDPWISTNGYKYCYDEVGEIALYHRLIAETYLGRQLRLEERVTFLDKDRLNCSVENLAIISQTPLTEFLSE